MPKTIPDENWPALCKEFRKAQATTLAALCATLINGMMTPGGWEALDEAEAAQAAVRARMDEFIARHGAS
jgi:hypothetical protein